MSSRQSLPHGFVGYKDLWLCRCWLRQANDAQSDGDNFLCIDSRFGISGLELGQGERVEFSDEEESVGKSKDGRMGQLCPVARLGWLDHQRPRVIDRPVPELVVQLLET